MTNATTGGDVITKYTQRKGEYTRQFQDPVHKEKPYFMVLNCGLPIDDLGQRKTVTPAGSNCPITPGSRFLQVRSRVCQRNSSNLRSRVLLIS